MVLSELHATSLEAKLWGKGGKGAPNPVGLAEGILRIGIAPSLLP